MIERRGSTPDATFFEGEEEQLEYERRGPGHLWLRARGRVAVLVLGAFSLAAIPFLSIVAVVYLLR